MCWLFFFLLLLPPVHGILNFDFELCKPGRSPLFYQERLHNESTVAFITINDCVQMGTSEEFSAVGCTPLGFVELEATNVFPPGVTLKAEMKSQILAQCKKDRFFLADKRKADLRRDTTCVHYEPSMKDPVRFYLICDERLPNGDEPVLLAVTQDFSLEKKLEGNQRRNRRFFRSHRMRTAFYGWCGSIVIISSVLLGMVLVHRENHEVKTLSAESSSSFILEPMFSTETQTVTKTVSRTPPLGNSLPPPLPLPPAAPEAPLPGVPVTAPSAPSAEVTKGGVVATSSLLLDPTQQPTDNNKQE